MLTIHPEIKFIGVVDDNLDLFEGQYPLPKGISYNSYLINDEHIAVIDAVDRRRRTDWLENLREALSDRQPDYLIVQHVEPHHSACVVDALNRYPSMKVVASAKAIAMLGNFFEDFDFEERSIAVKEGDILDLGRAKLKFVMAPMVHWPEVMVTLDLTDGILFSADAFGTFATPWSTEPWDDEGRRYYCNIVGKYGNNVQTLMKKLTGAGFHTICPLHGPVLRDNLAHYWPLYDKWSRWEPETDGVLVAYASIYGGTAEAARRLASMLDAQGAGDVILMDLERHDFSSPRRSLPAQPTRSLLGHLRCRAFPRHARLPPSSRSQEFPQPQGGNRRKRFMGPNLRKTHGRALLRDEGYGNNRPYRDPAKPSPFSRYTSAPTACRVPCRKPLSALP